MTAGLSDFNNARLERYSKKQKEWINNSKKRSDEPQAAATTSGDDDFADVGGGGSDTLEVEPW